MKRLYIVGAGGFARELYEIIKAINKIALETEGEARYDVLGFLDDNPNALEGKNSPLKVVGSISGYTPKDGECLALGIAHPQTKEKIASLLDARSVTWESIIHPSVRIAEGAVVGRGIVAYPGAILGPDTKTGDFVTLLSTGLGHDAEVGDYSTISSFCGINGYVKLGKRVYIGSHASLLPQVKVGDDGYVGIGSVVIRNVPAGTKVFGNPAKKMDF